MNKQKTVEEERAHEQLKGDRRERLLAEWRSPRDQHSADEGIRRIRDLMEGVLIRGAQDVRSLSVLPIARAAGSPLH
ncbi:MAG: hypothetical protein JO122_06345 [Acetobacteraceae bacterium]|nr:hypothetical protein [Acetobacteraceae bacterium]